jgi:hypothetical protein
MSAFLRRILPTAAVLIAGTLGLVVFLRRRVSRAAHREMDRCSVESIPPLVQGIRAPAAQQSGWLNRLPGWVFALALISGGGCLALLAARSVAYASYSLTPFLATLTIHHQFALLAGGGLLVGLGLGGRKRLARTSVPLPRQDRWLLAGIMLLAFVLRVWNLEQSVFMFVDEHGSVLTINNLRNPDVPLLLPSWSLTGWGQTYGYVQSYAVALFGANFTGLRAVSVLVGTLTIPALYFLAGELFNRRVALLAALWLATFPAHIHYSRLGVPNVADPLFGVLALGFLARGWETRARRDFALAGVMLGFGQYFYEAGRFAFPLLCLVLAGSLALRRSPTKDRPDPAYGEISPLSGMLILVVAAVVIGAPHYYAQVTNGLPLTLRFADMNVAGDYLTALRESPGRFLMQYMAPPFLHYVSLPDQSNLYYGGDYGLILPYLVPLYLVGLVMLVIRWRQPGSILLLAWMAGVALGNGLIQQNVFTSRYVVVFPALALTMVVGIEQIVQSGCRVSRRLFASFTPDPMGAAARLLVEAAIMLALTQAVYYYGQHLERYNQQIRPYYDFIETAARARNFPPGTHIHIITRDAYSDWQYGVTTSYYGLDVRWEQILPANFRESDLRGLPREVDHAFFVLPDDIRSLATIRGVFAAGPAQNSPYHVPLNRQYLLIYVPAEKQPSAGGS